jgi:bifunctional DNA-binding transcriptional regulator/antitoxin component of YhaV-PrlF toxin-antitoxin module
MTASVRDAETPTRLLSRLGPACLVTQRRYNEVVSGSSNARVSHRGQTSLPADLRRRWGIDEGGEVGFIDLGGAALIVPGGVEVARAELRRVLRDRYDEGVASIDDPDLADQ